MENHAPVFAFLKHGTEMIALSALFYLLLMSVANKVANKLVKDNLECYTGK